MKEKERKKSSKLPKIDADILNKEQISDVHHIVQGKKKKYLLKKFVFFSFQANACVITTTKAKSILSIDLILFIKSKESYL